jgi:putative transposase
MARLYTVRRLHDGRQATLLNGRHLRSVRRYQNKLKGRLAALRARKTRGSRRWKRLVRSAQRQLGERQEEGPKRRAM